MICEPSVNASKGANVPIYVLATVRIWVYVVQAQI